MTRSSGTEVWSSAAELESCYRELEFYSWDSEDSAVEISSGDAEVLDH